MREEPPLWEVNVWLSLGGHCSASVVTCA